MFGKQKLSQILVLSAIASSEVTNEQLSAANAALEAQNIKGVKLVSATETPEGSNPFSELQDAETPENLTAANLKLKELGLTSSLMSSEDISAFSKMKTSLSASGFDSIEALAAAQIEGEAVGDPLATARMQKRLGRTLLVLFWLVTIMRLLIWE